MVVQFDAEMETVEDVFAAERTIPNADLIANVVQIVKIIKEKNCQVRLFNRIVFQSTHTKPRK